MRVDAGTHWPDACGHTRPRDKYLGSFTSGDGKYDVFVYQDNALAEKPDMHVCIRYGARCDQYISPGNVVDFVRRFGRAQRAASEEYRLALPFLEKYLKDEGVRVLSCDMHKDCADPVSYIDDKGYVYCSEHGNCRKPARPCRKLQPSEIVRLEAGQTISYRRRA